MSRAEDFVATLEAAGQKVSSTRPGSWMVECPAHEDRTPSLSVRDGDKGVLLTCHAGCGHQEIAAAVGWSVADLFEPDSEERPARTSSRPTSAPLPTADELARAQAQLAANSQLLGRVQAVKGWSAGTLTALGVGYDRSAGRLLIPVEGADRTIQNVLRYRPRENGDRPDGERKMLALAGRPRDFFPAPEGIQGDEIWIVEGEPDAISGHELGLPAVGLPGVEFARRAKKWASRFASKSVCVLLDCDEKGRAAANTIGQALVDVAAEVRVVDLDPSRQDGYDLSDWLREAEGDVEAAAGLLRRLAADTPPVATQQRSAVVEAQRQQGDDWPDPPAAIAFSGLAGDIVETIEPHTEADPTALLVQVLVAFGNACGRGPGFMVEGDFHATNLYTAIVGTTSKGRKGTSWGRVRQVVALADPAWAQDRILGGLSSGEGLIWQVRDPQYKTVPILEGKKPTGEHREELVDAGVDDKRLLIVEGELAQAFKVMRREGSTLSPVIRELWDRGDTRTLTKNQPGKATGALVSIVGHITREELRRELTQTEAANGFANRFLFVCARRSKELPEGGSLKPTELDALAARVRESLRRASVHTTLAPLVRDSAARSLWRDVYGELSRDRPGLVGAVTSRAEAQTMRLAALYALLEGSPTIGEPHLRAALALWEYCERSARHIFGTALGDQTADTILSALTAAPEGLSRTEIYDLFQRHEPKQRIETALELLRTQDLAKSEVAPTGGRPVERWYAR